VFVGNIAFDATEDELKNVFEENGLTPTGARILTRPDGNSKG
jgi:RNA recognition motif-containing protein